MSGTFEGPQRAHVFAVKIGADTRDELVRALHIIAGEIDRGELSAGVSGGPGSGYVYAYRHDPTMTHDRYFQEIDAWIEKERRQGQARTEAAPATTAGSRPAGDGGRADADVSVAKGER